MEKNLFNDLVASCKEAIECEKGNIELKSAVIEIPNDEIVFYTKYRKLPENAKQAIHVILDEMLHA
jgi:hypothetical protein